MKKISFITLILLLFSCQNKDGLPYFNSPNWDPDFHKGTHVVGEFSFTNQKGKTITQNDYQNKVHIVNFFYTTCPGICKKMTFNMKDLQDHFSKEANILFLSHSVLPEFDTPEMLLKYALNNGVDDSKWNLVTGDKESIYKMAREEYFIEQNAGFKKSLNELIHTEQFLLIDSKRHIRGIYNGTNKLEMKRLIEDTEILLKAI